MQNPNQYGQNVMEELNDVHLFLLETMSDVVNPTSINREGGIEPVEEVFSPGEEYGIEPVEEEPSIIELEFIKIFGTLQKILAQTKEINQNVKTLVPNTDIDTISQSFADYTFAMPNNQKSRFNVPTDAYEDSDQSRRGVYSRVELLKELDEFAYSDMMYDLEKQNDFIPPAYFERGSKEEFLSQIVDTLIQTRNSYATSKREYHDINGEKYVEFEVEEWLSQLYDVDKNNDKFDKYQNIWGWGHGGAYFNYGINEFLRYGYDGNLTAQELIKKKNPRATDENWDMFSEILGLSDIGIGKDTTLKEISEMLTNALNSSEGLNDNTVLYRGGFLNTDEDGLGVLSGITSTTYVKDMAEEYKKQNENNYLMRIFAPKGTKGMANPEVASEFTLAPDQQYIELYRDDEKKEATLLLLTDRQASALKTLQLITENQKDTVSASKPLANTISMSQPRTQKGESSSKSEEEDIDEVTAWYEQGEISLKDYIILQSETLTKVDSYVNKTKSNWSEYLGNKQEKMVGIGDKWDSYLSDKAINYTAYSLHDEDEKRTFKNKKDTFDFKDEDAEYLAQKYNIDVGDKEGKSKRKYVKDTLKKQGKWDEATDDLYHQSKIEEVKERGIGEIAQERIQQNYIDPWKTYAKDKAKEKIEEQHNGIKEEAEWYRQGYIGEDDVSTSAKIYAKGLDYKDKIFGKDSDIGNPQELLEMIQDPEKLEAFAKKKLAEADEDSYLGQVNTKLNRGKELLSDPEKMEAFLREKYAQGQSEYDSYTDINSDTSYKDLSLAGKAMVMGRQVLDIGEDESITDILQDPERTMEVWGNAKEAYEMGGLGGLLGSDEEINVKDIIKDKMASIFNKEDIADAIDEGIDDGTDGGEGGFFSNAKKKLAGIFGFPEEDEEVVNVSKDKVTVEEPTEEETEADFATNAKKKMAGIFGNSNSDDDFIDIGKDKYSIQDDEDAESAIYQGRQKLGGLLGTSEDGTLTTTAHEMEAKISSPGAMDTSESILPIDEDGGDLPDISGNLKSGGKIAQKVGGFLKGKKGIAGKAGNVLERIGGGATKAGNKGIGGIAKSGISKLGKTGVGKAGGRLMSKVGGKIAGKVGGKIATKVGAQVASKVLAGGLAATGIGAPLAAIMASPIGGFLMEGAMNLGGKALGAVGGAIKGVGNFLFGGPKLPGQKGGGGLLGGLMAASPIGMLAGAAKAGGGILGGLMAANPLGLLAGAGSLLGGIMGGKGPGNMNKIGKMGLIGMAKPLGGMVGLLTKMFSNDKQTKSLNEKMEAHAGKTLEAIREQNSKSAPNNNSSSGGNITIQNININTADDPEAIKAMFLELIIELQEQVNPRLVSRTAGQAPESSTTTSTEDTSTEDTSTDKNSGTVGEGASTTDSNQTGNTN
jgi:hypothetical protein